MIHSEVRGETYHAAIGLGAFLDGERLTPAATAELPVTLVGTSQPPFITAQPNAAEQAGRSLSAVLPHVGAVGNLGPTSLQIADVAAGRTDGFWLYGRDAGNLLGASLIAQEAGVVVSDADGNPWHPQATSFLAAPAQLHAESLGLLKNASSPPAALSRRAHRSAGHHGGEVVAAPVRPSARPARERALARLSRPATPAGRSRGRPPARG
ncbi:inositol monophosphatase family protein [Amycolatopsis sp. NPDC049253]|uniref:inositol monophosphatase family protein n=1 Tax=Amycolatopsis sp. NPDC049253 TaxID=3155274 RepID=UPI0034386796